MSEQQDQHFDRAAEHFREAILSVQDVIYGMIGVLGALLVAASAFHLDQSSRDVRQVVAVGVVLMAIAGIRWSIRQSSRSQADPEEVP